MNSRMFRARMWPSDANEIRSCHIDWPVGRNERQHLASDDWLLHNAAYPPNASMQTFSAFFSLSRFKNSNV